MVRFLLLSLLLTLVLRAGWQLLFGILQGFAGSPPKSRAPQKRVQMARDPVCGTFVVPDRALVLHEGSPVYFCSTECRDKYRARPSTGSGRSGHVEGRTA